MQVPFGAGGASHPADGDHRVAVLVMRQVPHSGEPVRVVPGRRGERGDVLSWRRVSKRGQFGRVLPGQLAAQGVRMSSGGHQPGVPADRSFIKVLVEVISDAPEMSGYLERPPLRARRLRGPGEVIEQVGDLAEGLDSRVISS